VIYGDGEQSRDFVYVENVVRANIEAAESSSAAGEVLNVASGEAMTVNALLEAVNGVLGTKVEAVHAAPRPGDIRHSAADVAKAGRLLGGRPGVPFLAGLRETVESYRQRS
jgi:UDP-glucose 4-epimerase